MPPENTPTLIHHFFSRSARKWPDKTAFEFNDRTLSYAEVEIRSNRLANLLVQSGVHPSDRVGVYLNKSLEIPVAVYGILKAGAVFVPIDPGAPPARVAFIIKDCRIKHLVTLPERKKSLNRAMDAGAQLDLVVGLDSQVLENSAAACVAWDDLKTYPDSAPADHVNDQDLAYILYTSGSTGEPKGMMHTHSSGIAYAVYAGNTYGITPEDRMGNHTRLHFDMALFEFFAGPFRGATTVIIPEEAMIFPATLAKLIEDKALTIWFSVPLALIQLMAKADLEKRPQPSLRWVIYAGEPFPTKQMLRLMKTWPHARYSNVYGPAEVNQCTVYNFDADSLDPDRPIPLGRVWDGATGIIEKSENVPAEQGETGELLIASSTMMRGYWQRPDLTEKGIVVRESLQGAPQRFYRTGDLVHIDDRGIMHFHGRIDRQIKLRGYRIEPDEIENVLHGMKGVKEAAVILQSDASEDKHLVAVILATGNTDLSEEAARKHLVANLPTYAIPERIFFAEDLPRTSTGKIDRLKLAANLPQKESNDAN